MTLNAEKTSEQITPFSNDAASEQSPLGGSLVDAITERMPVDQSMLSSVTTNLLAGLTGSLSMVPEALAFSTIAGVPPIVGVQSAAVLAVVASLTGGQPGNVSGAAGVTAVVVAPLATTMGQEYLYAAVVTAGVLQVRTLLRLSKLGRRGRQQYACKRACSCTSMFARRIHGLKLCDGVRLWLTSSN